MPNQGATIVAGDGDMEMMRWDNFTYVWHQEGWRSGISIAIFGWITMPWKDIRIKIASWVLVLLRVKGYFED